MSESLEQARRLIRRSSEMVSNPELSNAMMSDGTGYALLSIAESLADIARLSRAYEEEYYPTDPNTVEGENG